MILVRSVKPLEKFLVLLEFSNGEQKTIDLDPLLHGPVFEALRQDPKLFRAMHVDENLGTVVWDNGADMDPDVLYGSHRPAWMETKKVSTA
jgi:hypothetical protein